LAPLVVVPNVPPVALKATVVVTFAYSDSTPLVSIVAVWPTPAELFFDNRPKDLAEICAFATSVAEDKTAAPVVERATAVNNELFAAPINGLVFVAEVETEVP
jgi:hypothetical protein